MPFAMEQLSLSILWATTTELMYRRYWSLHVLEPMLHNKRCHHNEKPIHCNEELPLLTTKPTQQWRLSTVKINKYIKLFFYLTWPEMFEHDLVWEIHILHLWSISTQNHPVSCRLTTHLSVGSSTSVYPNSSNVCPTPAFSSTSYYIVLIKSTTLCPHQQSKGWS